MMLHIRFLDLERRATLSAYAGDVLTTLRELSTFVGAKKKQWRSEVGLVPDDIDGLISHLGNCRVRNNVGHVMEQMGISARFFLPATPELDIYVTFDVGISSQFTAERVIIELDSSLISWQRMHDMFIRGIEVWKPKTADVMNSDSLVVVSEQLRGRIPVGFACYRSGAFLFTISECASKIDLNTGSAVFLKNPHFDRSRDEGEKLARIAALFP